MSVVALSGGVGGAKLALGLARIVPAAALTVIANPGDDFEHLGLTVCPDLDTLLYTLAGVANPETGWGRADESWRFMEALGALGGETWFRLGDRDLALHVERTRRLRAGEPLSAIMADIAARLGISARLLPASDQPVRTKVQTGAGELAFQHYFVRERCEPRVTGFRFEGAMEALPAPGLFDALEAPDLETVVVCPSNPFISIDPILTVPGIRAALGAVRAPVVAVSPLIGGRAVKGPTAKMMDELGLEATPMALAARYADFLDGVVLDRADTALAPAVEALGLAAHVAPTLMVTLDDRIALTREVLGFAARLAGSPETKENAR